MHSQDGRRAWRAVLAEPRLLAALPRHQAHCLGPPFLAQLPRSRLPPCPGHVPCACPGAAGKVQVDYTALPHVNARAAATLTAAPKLDVAGEGGTRWAEQGVVIKGEEGGRVP